MRAALLAAVLTVCCGAVAVAAPYGAETPPPVGNDQPIDLGEHAQVRRAFEAINAGFVLYERGEFGGAEAKFRAAIAADPPEPQGSTAYYDLGLVLARTGRYDQSREAFDSALARDPGILPAWLGLVYVDLRRSDYEAAQRDARALRASAPSSALARFQEGYAALLAGKYDLAASAFAALLPGNGRVASVRYDLGLALLHAGRLADARAQALYAVALAPRFAKAYFLLGSIALRADDRTEAAREFGRARELSVDPALRLLCSDLLAQLGSR